MPTIIRRKKTNPTKSKFSPTQIIIILFTPILLSSCAPTYPKEKVIDAIKTICQKQYNTEVEAKKVNRTMCVLAPAEHFFSIDDSGKLNINPQKQKDLNGLVFSVGRVLFNSDIDIDFYLIKLAKEEERVELSFIGCVKDLKKAWLGSFAPGELGIRRIFDLKKYNKEDLSGMKRFEEVAWPDFLVKQIRQRLKVKFPGKVELVGKYKEGDEFIFILAASQGNTKIIPFVLKTIARVIEVYQFEAFNSIRLLDINTGELNILDKERLKRYR